MKKISTPHAPAAIGPYSQAMVSNGFLFTSGQIALVPETGEFLEGDITVQATQVLKNLDGVLAAAGATWNHVVKTTVYLIDMKDFTVFNQVYGQHLGEARPARTTIAAHGLPRNACLEIDLVVELP